MGKYRAYMELHNLDPNITIDDIRGLSMREIKDVLQRYLSENEWENTNNDAGKGHRYAYGK